MITLGSLSIAIVDLVVLAIILIFAIVGLVKGFCGQVVNLISGLAAFVIAFLLFQTVYSILVKLDFVQSFLKILENAFSKINLPFLNALATKRGVTVAIILAEYVFKLIVFILLWILATIALVIVKRIIKSIARLPVINVFDRLLGLALGACWGLVFVAIICIILYFLKDVEFIKNFANQYLLLGKASKCYVRDIVYNNANTIISFFIKLYELVVGKIATAIA